MTLGAGSPLAQPAPEGAELFERRCSSCHVGESRIGPLLAPNRYVNGPENIVRRILFGGGAMAGFAARLSDEEIAAIANYVRITLNGYDGVVTPEFVSGMR